MWCSPTQAGPGSGAAAHSSHQTCPESKAKTLNPSTACDKGAPREYRGRLPITGEGADTRCSRSWSMSTPRPGFGRTCAHSAPLGTRASSFAQPTWNS